VNIAVPKDNSTLGAGSLEQANDELCDAYMNYKDLANRCTIDFAKSQFSIYDAFAGQSDDQSKIKQRNFSSMIRVDPNIFRDVATNSNLIPNEESLTEEVTRMSIKVIRLKASPWIEYVSVYPRISDRQRRQDALLSSEDNPIDQMLVGAMNFLDVNDLASLTLYWPKLLKYRWS